MYRSLNGSIHVLSLADLPVIYSTMISLDNFNLLWSLCHCALSYMMMLPVLGRDGRCVWRRVAHCCARPARPDTRPAGCSTRASCLPVQWRDGSVSGAVSCAALRDLPALLHVPPWAAVARPACQCGDAMGGVPSAVSCQRAPCLPVRWRLAGGAEGGVLSVESCAALLAT